MESWKWYGWADEESSQRHSREELTNLFGKNDPIVSRHWILHINRTYQDDEGLEGQKQEDLIKEERSLCIKPGLEHLDFFIEEVLKRDDDSKTRERSYINIPEHPGKNAAVEAKKKPKKDDYQKNVPNFVTKTFIKQMLDVRNRPRVSRHCQKHEIRYAEFETKLKDWQRIQAVGLGDLYDILWRSGRAGEAFRGLFIWFLRGKYLPIACRKGRMENTDVYIECKNALIFLAVSDPRAGDTA